MFAPSWSPEEIVEIAQRLREQAGLPKQATGEVSEESAGLFDTLAKKTRRAVKT